MMYPRIMIMVAVFLATATACKQDNKTTTPSGAKIITPVNDRYTPLYGNWIAIDFCSYARQYGSVLMAMNNTHVPYAYAFTFTDSDRDSILCSTATESWKRPIRFQADTLIEVLDARNGKSVFLSYSPTGNKDMTLYDSSLPKTSVSRYIRSAESSKSGYASFLTALQNQLMVGKYRSTGKSAGTVEFFPNGEVTGLEGYDRYAICTGGDCFIAGQDSDVISLSNSKTKDAARYFGFKFEPNRTALSIYELVQSNPNEKGTAKPGKMLYKLAR
jgi:hypothetical protein